MLTLAPLHTAGDLLMYESTVVTVSLILILLIITAEDLLMYESTVVSVSLILILLIINS